MTVPGPPRRVRRSRSDAVLGGVCAGVARSAGLDPLLLRVAVVAVTVLTAGAGLVAYLAAWALVPREADVRPDTGPATAPQADAVDGTTAAPGGDPAGPGTTDLPTGAVPPPRSPLTAADDAPPAEGAPDDDARDDDAAAPGERSRREVRAGARRTAAGVSQALSARVDQVGRRVRRDPPT